MLSSSPTSSPELTPLAKAFQAKIASRELQVGVVGQGYVGLPLALCFAEKGVRTLGFDVDQKKVDALNAGQCYIQHLDKTRLTGARESNLFEATTDFSRLASSDAILIAVPTPLSPQREPDMRYVVATAEAVAKTLRPGQLVVLESTTWPGTTDELVRGILDEKTGLVAGVDYFLAFSPEREDPGNPDFSTSTIPKVVGGFDPVSGDLAQAVYDLVVSKTVRVSSTRTAEAAKLTENIFRAVNIALVNELKVVYDKMGIDVWEVLDAASTKPFGFMRFNPGPGWGGHCIPLDPFYLSWKARENGVAPKFIELAGEVNVEMVDYVVGKVQNALNQQKKAVNGSKVLVLGIAYKKNIDDPRESPAFPIIDRLLEIGADVSYHDPHIPTLPRMRHWPKLPAMTSTPLNPETLAMAYCVFILTDHSAVDYNFVADHSALVVDTRGVLREPRDNVVKA